MKERTIELLLLAGIVLLSAFIVMMLTKRFVLPFAGRVAEGFQTAATASAASPPPNLQKMMMVLIGPGGGTNATDGDVFLSKIGTDFTDPVWEKYPPDLATTTQAIGKFPAAAKIRIDGGGTTNSFLNFERIRIFNRTGSNIASTATVTTNSERSDFPPSSILLPNEGREMYHSAGTAGVWIEVKLTTPAEVTRIEIDNRTNCCQERLTAYTLRVYDSAGNEFFSRPLTADLKQSYSLTERERTATIQGSGSMTGKEGSNMVVKLRIDGGGATNVTETLQPYLNFHKIRIFNSAGVNINSTATATANTFNNDQTKPSNVLSADANLSVYHSAGMVGEWVEIKLNTPSQISRVEIDNRPDCCQGRLANYTLRAYNTYGIEIYSSRLTADNKQTYTLTAPELSTPMSSISGAEGRLFATNSANSIFATKPYTKTSEGVWNVTGGALKQVSRDTRDGRSMCGVNAGNDIWCATQNIEFSPNWTRIATKQALWISVSNGRAAIIADDNQLYYTPNYMAGSWQPIQSNLGTRLMKQVALDDTRIGALDMEGNIYMADLTLASMAQDGGLGGTVKWFQLSGKKARYLELRLGRMLIIADDDGKIYYGDDYRYGRWQSVPMPDGMREVFMAGKDSGFGYSFNNKTQAQATCEALGATLATGAQLQAAWRNGANWCSCAWTTDIGKQYPNNENMTNWCGGPQPGLKDCGTDETYPANATCFGKKTKAANVARFNTKFWNAPPLAIEFVPFSTVDPLCGDEGFMGTFKGERFRYYSRIECDNVGKRLRDGRTTEYFPAIGECRIAGRYSCYNYSDAELARIRGGASEQAVCEVNGRIFSRGDETKAPGCGSCWCCQPPAAPAPRPLSLSRQLCVNVQDRPGQTISQIWDDGSTGNCVFNPEEYAKKYSLVGDIGTYYQHWLDTGLKAGYSPCGNINPSCRWDPDTYYKMNPAARGQAPRDPEQHYRQIGLKQGAKFCNASGVFPLLDAFTKLFDTKKIVNPAADLLANCQSQTVATGVPRFEAREVFFVNVPAGIAKASAAAKCTEFGATVATRQQLKDAQINGANWCEPGWIENAAEPHYAMTIPGSCAGTPAAGIYAGPATATVKGVNCYGKKPDLVANSPLRAFNGKQWSLYGASAAQTTARRWTCANRAFADRMFTGPGNSDETYLGRDDVVCFTDNPETKTFYCRSAQEFRNGEDYSAALADSYESSCNIMSQALTDLSGAITTISNIEGGLRNGAQTIGDAASTLNQVYTKYNCSNATPEMKAMCNVLEASRNKVLASSQAISSTNPTPGNEGVLNAVLAPMAQAKASREDIVGTMKKIQCAV